MYLKKLLNEIVSVEFDCLPYDFCRLNYKHQRNYQVFVNGLSRKNPETRVLRPIQFLHPGNLFTYHSSCMKSPKISCPAFQPEGRMKIKMRVQQSQMQDKPKESAWKGKDEELAWIGQEKLYLERERNQQLRKERIRVNSDREEDLHLQIT